MMPSPPHRSSLIGGPTFLHHPGRSFFWSPSGGTGFATAWAPPGVASDLDAWGRLPRDELAVLTVLSLLVPGGGLCFGWLLCLALWCGRPGSLLFWPCLLLLLHLFCVPRVVAAPVLSPSAPAVSCVAFLIGLVVLVLRLACLFPIPPPTHKHKITQMFCDAACFPLS